jgi:hypothetical protein
MIGMRLVAVPPPPWSRRVVDAVAIAGSLVETTPVANTGW